MRKWVNWSIFAAVGLLLAVGVMIFHFFILPIALRYQVRKTLALENGTEAWERFEVTPIPLTLKMYFFKVDNPDEMVKGHKPKVSEIGPYVYKENWKKYDLRIDEEKDSVFYRQGIEFVFDQEASGNLSDTDNVTVANPVIHALAAIINAIPTVDIVEELMEFGLPELLGDNFGPLLTARVKDLLFDGMTVPCGKKGLSFSAKLFCSALKNFAPTPNLRVTDDGNIELALLKFKELGPLYELVRGYKDPDNMGKIVSVDGKTETNSWKCKEANKVQGYDLVMLPSFLTKSSTIPIYTSELRTSVHAVFKEDTSFRGIDGYRFGMTWSILGDIKEDKDAKCYCPGSVKGLTVPRPCWEGAGILDLGTCVDIPATLSLPHFYTASENYISLVDGLDPNPKIHESYLDVEPTTGVPLRGYKRVQVNVWTHKLPALKLYKDFVTSMLPLLWFEEGTELGDEQIAMIRDQLLRVMSIEEIIRWALFGLGLGGVVLGTTMAVIRRKQDLDNTSSSVSEQD